MASNSRTRTLSASVGVNLRERWLKARVGSLLGSLGKGVPGGAVAGAETLFLPLQGFPQPSHRVPASTLVM